MSTSVDVRTQAPPLLYDPETHTSTCGDRPVPHVTAVLAACGMSTDFSALPRVVRDRAGWKRALGTAVHLDCHAYDDDDLDWATLDPQVRPYVEAWATARANLRLRPVQRERQVFDRLHWYTGILDAICEDPDGPGLALVDLKVGDPRAAAADLQTGSYAQAWERQHSGSRITRRMAVWLRPGRRVPYTVDPYDGVKHSRDFQKFLACLTVYNEQVARRGRPRAWLDKEDA